MDKRFTGEKMNELQEAIYQVIISIFKNELLSKEFENHEEYRGQKIINNSAIRYGILNYVARYSLANDEYFITDKCLNYLNELDLINDRGLLRGKKGSKYKFTFEHPVPSNIIADLLYENYNDETRLRDILKETDIVTVLTYEENEMLNKAKLTSKMPLNWQIFENNNFERYVFTGIEIPQKKIPVYGALAR